MRVVLDTNILISALLLASSTPAQAVHAWRRGQFQLLTCEMQLQELREVTRRPKIRDLVRPALAGELVNQLRGMAQIVDKLPAVDLSPDPFDNFLLALSMGGQADVLVSGDKRGILAFKTHERCRILTLRVFLDELAARS
jgi:uncharacterized protein